jgi:hypothetical protein
LIKIKAPTRLTLAQVSAVKEIGSRLVPKRFSRTTVRVLTRLSLILFWAGFAAAALSIFLLPMFGQRSIAILFVAISSLLTGFACRLLTERFGVTDDHGVMILKAYTASIIAIIGIFLIANGIQHLGGSARPNAFGQECWDTTCYHLEWIALGAIGFGRRVLLISVTP